MSVANAPKASTGNKVTIVGAGNVGIACAVAILAQNVSNDVCMVDPSEDKMIGELWDLQQGSVYLNNPNLTAGTDYALSAGSRICIITAGARQNPNETRLELLQRNVDIVKNIVRNLIKYSPDAIFILVTNPVDIMAYLTWKISGLPKERVIGTGTSLDTARFRYFIGERLTLPPSSVHGWIVGEHGDSSVPVWSGVSAESVSLRSVNPTIGLENDSQNFGKCHEDTVRAAYNVIQKKGYTNWAIGFTTSALVKAIIANSNAVNTVSVMAKGYHGIDMEVYISLPCILTSAGAKIVPNFQMDEIETELFKKSAKLLYDTQCGIKL